MNKEEAGNLFEKLDKISLLADEISAVADEDWNESDVPHDIQYAFSYFAGDLFRNMEGLHTFLHNAHHIPSIEPYCDFHK